MTHFRRYAHRVIQPGDAVEGEEVKESGVIYAEQRHPPHAASSASCARIASSNGGATSCSETITRRAAPRRVKGALMAVNDTPLPKDTQCRRRYRRLIPSRTIGATFLNGSPTESHNFRRAAA